MNKINNIFSLRRMGMYLMKFYAEMRSLKFQFVAITAVLTLVLLMSDVSKPSFGDFALILLVFAAVAASSMSAFFALRVNKIKFMLTPVSQFEKFLAMVLHVYVCVPVLFALSLVIAQYFSTLLMGLITQSAPLFTAPLSIISWGNQGWAFMFFYMVVIAFYLMGATIFVKHSFVKTTVLVFVLMIMVAIFAMTYIMNLLSHLSTGELNYEYLARLSSNIKWIVPTIMTVVSLIFLSISYLRITEMEVNETKR